MIDDDLMQIARDGAKAVAVGDTGRSAYLVKEVERIVTQLTKDEVLWLSIAVSNSSMAAQFAEETAAAASDGQDVGMQQTGDGEVWQI